MTIKEISELTGKSKRSVERWVESCDKMTQVCDKITQAKQTKKSADFMLDETIEILRAGKISEGIIHLLKDNAEKNIDLKQRDLLSTDNKGLIKNIVLESLYAIMPIFEKMIDAKIKPIELKQIEAPKKDDRQAINEIVRDYCKANRLDFSVGWHMLYKEFSYRKRINVSMNASKANMKPLDWINFKGYISELLAVAREYLR